MSAADVLSRERFFLLVFFHVFFLSSCSLESTTHVDSLESIGISAIHYITKPPFFVQNKKTFISVALTILRACNMSSCFEFPPRISCITNAILSDHHFDAHIKYYRRHVFFIVYYLVVRETYTKS